MHANKLFLAASATSALGLVTVPPGVNVYFGQTGTDTLGSYCESGGFDTVTLAYLSASPETDPATNYPATNFGSHCSAAVYVANNTASRLLSDYSTLSQDILFCQKQGIKVLLSTGGVWGPDSAHNYDVTTAANGEYFAEFLWKAFGPFYPSWTGPRPFDTDSENHTVLDGFDFDIEVQIAGQSGYVALLNQLRSYVDEYNGLVSENPIIITGAPLCPLADGWPQMKDLITSAFFDKLWIQFYGNDLCPAGSSGFNYDEWETFIANTTSKDAFLYVGLPAYLDVTGYMTAAEANALVDGLKNRSSFGGVMVNDVAVAKANADGGVPLYQTVYEHLRQEEQGPMMTASATSSEATTGSITNVVVKTESVTISLTKTIFGAAPTSIPPMGANSTVFGTGTAFVTASCVPASRTVSASPIGGGLPSGTRTSATHSYSYSVTSAGQVLAPNGMAGFVIVVAMAVVVLEASSCLVL